MSLSHRPLIGITPSVSEGAKNVLTNRGYYESIVRAGGLPMLLPLTDDPEVLDACLSILSGLLFSGGPDVSPERYGETVHAACGPVNPTRDAMETLLLRSVLRDRPMPVLGICRGLQVINVILGGTLYQDLPSEYPAFLYSHNQTEHEFERAHSVTVLPDTPLSAIVGTDHLNVNSLHHQAILRLAPSLRPCAISEDGLTEGVFRPDLPFFLAVQWHPERLSHWDGKSQALFDAFVRAASARA